MKTKFILLSYIGILVISGFSACNKMLEVRPENETLAEDALQKPEDLVMLLNSCYDVMANAMNGRTQIFNELLSDNLDRPLNNDDFREIYTRSSNFFNGSIGSLYGDHYICVYRVNILNANIDQVPGVSSELKTKLLAEGAFLRGLAQFELVKLWAQPFGYSDINNHPGIVIRKEASQTPLTRSSVAAVYAAILDDLNFAVQNLPENNPNYADKDAAKALLAKVYFQMADYTNAAKYCDEVVASGRFRLGDSINRFLSPTPDENIFIFISTGNNDNRARGFVDNFRSDNNNTPQLRLSRELYDLLKFRPSDKRVALANLVNPGTDNELIATNKFNKDFFNIPYLNYTELLLNRIESKARINQDLSTAVNDLNNIMERAYGTGVVVLPPQSNPNDIITNVLRERRLELFGEGDRVQTLKRLGASGEPIIIRNAVWNCPGMILQFPISELTTGFELNKEGGCN